MEGLDRIYKNHFGLLVDGRSVCFRGIFSNPVYTDSPLFECDLELVVGLTRAGVNELQNCSILEVLTPP